MKQPALSGIVPALLAWYRAGARALPWRAEPTPYRVLVSELMLQQTRVETVIPYFLRFIERWPDFSSLAASDEQELLKYWEGLGYYSRARNLRRCAQQVVEQYGGELPADVSRLEKLPGIGAYTAGAVASIAFGLPVPAVDGNVLRVISRLTDSWDNISEAETKAKITVRVRKIIPADAAGKFNQALMDLGATICLPNGAPRCGECPVRSYCAGAANGDASRLPMKTAAKKRRIERRTVLVITDGVRLALRRRAENGLLAGLWELPNFEGAPDAVQAEQAARELGVTVLGVEPFGRAKHVFTHIEWELTGYQITCPTNEPTQGENGLCFVTPDELASRYPVAGAFAAFLRRWSKG